MWTVLICHNVKQIFKIHIHISHNCLVAHWNKHWTVWQGFLTSYVLLKSQRKSEEGEILVMWKMQNVNGSKRFTDVQTQLIRLNVSEFDKTVILHSKITKITPERPQITPNHTRSSQNRAFGTYFLYWASPNNISSLSPPQRLVEFPIRTRVLDYSKFLGLTNHIVELSTIEY